MKKSFIIVAICIISLLFASDAIFVSAKDTESVGVKDWKDYPMDVVVNKKPAVKALTPKIIQGNMNNPGQFMTYAKGKIEDTDIILINENKNDLYNEVGTDVMLIGNTEYGVPVSRIINIKNKLYECQVDPKGEKISLKPYSGECGEVDLVSGFKCDVPVSLAILSSSDIYIDVAKNKKTLLPAGDYTLYLGYVERGALHAAIKKGQMDRITVANTSDESGKKKITTLKWGKPFRMDFDFTADEKKVTVAASRTRIYGSANEEYYNFKPPLLPQVEVLDSKGEQVAKGACTSG